MSPSSEQLRGVIGAHEPESIFCSRKIESVEARDRYFPQPGEESEEFTGSLSSTQKAAAAWEKSHWGRSADIATDYAAVAE